MRTKKTRIDSWLFSNQEIRAKMVKRGPVRKIGVCMHDHTWLRLCEISPTCCNKASLLQSLHEWCGKRKCVTGIVREPFGGGGAFVVAEVMGRR